jgi:orotate phosphoribosyltransferase
VNAGEAQGLFERCGAMLAGHFQLSSGRHSDRYVEKARVLERPDIAMALAQEISSWYERVQVVVAPAVGAIPLGFAVALSAGARSVYAEREEGRMRLRRGFSVLPGERALVVEDVVTTGGSAREVYALVQESGGDLLGVAALIDRSTADMGLPLRAVLRVDAKTWDPGACPLCADGLPVESPGSRRIRTDSAPGEVDLPVQAEPSS